MMLNQRRTTICTQQNTSNEATKQEYSDENTACKNAIHPFSSAYLRSGHGGSSLSREEENYSTAYIHDLPAEVFGLKNIFPIWTFFHLPSY